MNEARRTTETGQRVLAEESAALALLSQSLGASFAATVEVLLQTTGRVVVAGMGKSGHVARKIAATLASTGTPAQFVHPAEASHGDLGMIAPGDTVLVLSNSGETAELSDLVTYARRFDIPLVAIIGRAGSTLEAQAKVTITMPAVAEAGPEGIAGLAPTTSTTLAMALGDALAVALMERREFTPDHYRVFHPGGSLGARLLRVQDLMHDGEALPLVARDAPMDEVLLQITGKGFGVAGVTDGKGSLVGIITDGDLRRHMQGLMSRRAAEVMTTDPRTVPPETLASRALGEMNTRKITCLFVVPAGADGRPVGILHIHDCLRAGVM